MKPMDPIQTLMDEHLVILEALSALDTYTDRLAAGEAPSSDLGDFVEFIRKFADGLHHRKEEDMLFSRMVENGFPRQGGPIAVMLMEHDEGRRLTGAMAALTQKQGLLDAEELRGLNAAARGYTALLRQHIYKEDNVLYPMAKMHLPAAVMSALGEEFEKFEAGVASERHRLLAIASRLVEAYPVTAEAETDGHACVCGGHATFAGAGK